ncbi:MULTISPECIES: LuxR C-terminal-related transcriptional regulator [Serratia]|uniref:LuxR C-terminal-related transcriptional regulator n=1 Tax=Serratia TaxID=613 RepID=UPI0009D75F99|nr:MULTISPECIES: LuxR C-terminal-related transcriptional regulator [Serratia]
MRRKKVVLQCSCNFMRTGLEALIKDTDLSVSLDIVDTSDSFSDCEDALNALPVVNLVILTVCNRDYNLASLLQLVGERLPKMHPNSKVVMISDIADVNPLKCYFSGLRNVSIILNKTITLDELSRELLSTTANNEKIFGKSSTMLTPRELEILRMLLDGDTARKIANDLKLNFRTVSHHKRAALAKLGVRSLCPLVNLIGKRKYNKRVSSWGRTLGQIRVDSALSSTAI